MTFEEDLIYANKILRIRTMLENQTYISNPHIRHNGNRYEILEYHMQRENGDDLVIGFHELRKDALNTNCYVDGALLLYNNNKTGRMQIPHTKKTSGGVYRYNTVELTEEWHFQQSLILKPDVLTATVVFNILDNVPTYYNYFHLNIRHVDEIIMRSKQP